MDMNKISTLSVRLSSALSESDMTATDLAKKVGISKQAISTYITGTRSPKLPTARAIAEVLNVDVMWLIGYDVSKEIKKPIADNDERLSSRLQIISGIVDKLTEDNFQLALSTLDTLLDHQEKQDK